MEIDAALESWSVEVYYAFPPQELVRHVSHRDSDGNEVTVSVRQDQSELVFQILDAQYRDSEARLTYDALLAALNVTQAHAPTPGSTEEKTAFLVEMVRRLELVRRHTPGNAKGRSGTPSTAERQGLYSIQFGAYAEYDKQRVAGELTGAALVAAEAAAAAAPQGPTFAELRTEGRRALMRGAYVDAAGLLQHAVDLQTDSADPKLWRDLGIALFEAWRAEDDDGNVRDAWTVASMQRLDTAHAAYAQALRFIENTLNPAVWAEAARLYLCLGAFEACADAGRRVISSFASSDSATEVLFIAAIALRQLGVYDEAVTYLQFLEQSPPPSAPKQLVQIVLALTYDQMGNTKQADKTYSRCFAEAKALAPSRERRGDDVLELKARSWQKWHSDPRLWLRMTLLAEVADHWILAYELQREAVRRKTPNEASYLWRLAECAWRARQVDDAVKAGDEACALDPSHDFYREVLGIWKEYAYSKSFQVDAGAHRVGSIDAMTQGGAGSATEDDRQISALRAFLASKNGGAGLTAAAKAEAHASLVELTASAADKTERRVVELQTKLVAAKERLSVIRDAASAAATVEERKKAALKLQEVFRKQAMRKLTPMRETAAVATAEAQEAEAVQEHKLKDAKEAMAHVQDQMESVVRYKGNAAAQAQPAAKKNEELRNLSAKVKVAQAASEAAQIAYQEAKSEAKSKRATAMELSAKMKKSLDSLAAAQSARKAGGGDAAPRATQADVDRAEETVADLALEVSQVESRAEMQRIAADVESGRLSKAGRRKTNGREDLRDHAASQAAARIRGHAYREKMRTSSEKYDASSALAKLARKQSEREAKKRGSAVTRLQAVARSRYTRARALADAELATRQKDAAMLIQQITRGKKTRAAFLNTESPEMMRLQKRLGDRKTSSASLIQKHARRRKAKKDVNDVRDAMRANAARRIQRSKRKHKPVVFRAPQRTSHSVKVLTPAEIATRALGTEGEWKKAVGKAERTRDLEISRHMGYMQQESCDYREHWRRVLASPFYPDAAHLRRRISIVKAQSPRCSDAEAFAGLAVSRGDITGAVQQLAQSAFRAEIRLVFAMFDLAAVVRAACVGEALPAELAKTDRREAASAGGPASPRRLAPLTTRTAREELTTRLLNETTGGDLARTRTIKSKSPKGGRRFRSQGQRGTK